MFASKAENDDQVGTSPVESGDAQASGLPIE
jgi:hypothetical protein